MMDTRENITLAMVPEFELNEEETNQVNAWAALDSKHSGMSAADIYIVFGLTQIQLAPFEREWEIMKGLVHA